MYALLVAAGTALSGCASSLPQTPFDAKGPVAQMQLDLLKLTLWFAIGIGAFVTLALLYVVFRFRQKGEEHSLPTQFHGSTILEITWTAIPILILAIVAVPTVQTAFRQEVPTALAASEAEHIKVVGHQWWFEFQYQDHKFTTANEMKIPVGKPVVLELISADVIHSFWIPKLAGKTDVLPNKVNRMWLEAEEAGEYFGQCAEFCGTSHANMRFRVQAVSQQEFDAWVSARQAGAQPPTDPKALAGKALFEGAVPGKANCIVCHSIDGTAANKGVVGPNLTDIGARSTLAAGIVANTEENLKKWIRDPESLKPGVKIMPKHPNLTAEELDQLVAYLRGLNK